MKVQLDTTALRRELHKVIYDDKSCAQWVRDFEYTLGCWGTNENPHPFAMGLIVEAEGYRATQSFKKMRAAVIKELGANASSEDVNKRLVEKYGEKRVKDICDAIHRANELSADAATREGAELDDVSSSPDSTSATLLPAVKPDAKHPHGEFQNVMLTDDEFEKWSTHANAEGLLDELSCFLASSGKKYKSHYATLLNWERRKTKDNKDTPKSFKQQDLDRQAQQVRDYFADFTKGV